MFVDPRIDGIPALDDAKGSHLPTALSELQEGLQVGTQLNAVPGRTASANSLSLMAMPRRIPYH
jgi:hypothetical protein